MTSPDSASTSSAAARLAPQTASSSSNKPADGTTFALSIHYHLVDTPVTSVSSTTEASSEIENNKGHEAGGEENEAGPLVVALVKVGAKGAARKGTLHA